MSVVCHSCVEASHQAAYQLRWEMVLYNGGANGAAGSKLQLYSAADHSSAASDQKSFTFRFRRLV